MEFAYPQFLWALPLVLLPWLVYFLRLYFGEKTLLPSLIFIEEASRQKRYLKKPWLVYLLQSLALLFFILAFSTPIIHSEKKFTCIVDDFIHAQWNSTTWQKVKANLQDPCSRQFYSLTSLILHSKNFTNAPLTVNEKNMYRTESFEPIFFLEFLSKKNWKSILWITPENHFPFSGVQHKFLQQIKFYPVSVDSKNHSFVQLSAKPDPLQRGRFFLQGKLQPPQRYNISLMYLDQTLTLLTDEQGSFTKNILLPPNVGEGVLLHATASGDLFSPDNQFFLVLKSIGPFSYQYNSNIPRTILSLLAMPLDRFPSFYFQPKKLNHQKSIVFYPLSEIRKSQKKSSIPIFFPQEASILSGVRKRFEKSTLLGENFPYQYTFASVEVPMLPAYVKKSKILLRFEDGMPAIIRFENGGGIFLFHPDSAAEELKESGTYAITLLNLLLQVVAKESISTISQESDWLRKFTLPPPHDYGLYEVGHQKIKKLKEYPAHTTNQNQYVLYVPHRDSLTVNYQKPKPIYEKSEVETSNVIFLSPFHWIQEICLLFFLLSLLGLIFVRIRTY